MNPPPAGTSSALPEWPVPWGMGWVRRFLKPEVLAPLPLGERYRLQLLVGFMAIGGALSLLSLVVTVTLEGRC